MMIGNDLTVKRNAKPLGRHNLYLFSAAIHDAIAEFIVFNMLAVGIYGKKLDKSESGDRLNKTHLQKAVGRIGTGRTTKGSAYVLAVGNRTKKHLSFIQFFAVGIYLARVFHSLDHRRYYACHIGALTANDLLMLNVYHSLCHRGIKSEIAHVKRISITHANYVNGLCLALDQTVQIQKILFGLKFGMMF